MPKEKAPIATRLRRRDKNPNYSQSQAHPLEAEKRKKEVSPSTTSVQSLEDNLSFSPRQDSNIHMDELHSDLSFVRGTEEEKSQYLIKEEDKLQKIFGESYSPRVKLSSFYSALVAPPVPSKRTRHQNTVVNSAHVSNEKLNATSTENKDKEPTYRERSPSRKTSTSVETDSSGDSEPSVSLPLSSTLSNPRKLNTKDKEKEYWRRQRRVFVHSRFLTNEEGVQVAKSVYSNLSISPSNRMIISFQGNIGNFRTKLRRIFDNYTNSFNITKDFLLKDESFQEQYIQQRLSTQILKAIWGHWIAEPFVNTKLFYADKESVNQLKLVTAKLMVIHYMEHFNMISPIKSRERMKGVDMISRKLVLPDTSEFA